MAIKFVDDYIENCHLIVKYAILERQKSPEDFQDIVADVFHEVITAYFDSISQWIIGIAKAAGYQVDLESSLEPAKDKMLDDCYQIYNLFYK